MTRALLTGAGGFCGRHLAGYLAAQDVEVHTLRPLRRDVDPVVGDLDPAALVPAIADARPDYVFHLAGVVTAPPATAYLVNVAYAAALLRALEAAHYGDRPVLLVGTGAEYGRISPDQLPIDETCPARPYNDYGVSKLAQTLVGLAAAERGQPVVVARPFNIIGPGMPSHLALQSFAEQIASMRAGTAEPVLRVGNLTSSRDFIDVHDVVRGYWKLIRTPAAYGQVVNVCSGVPVTLRAAVDLLVEISGVPLDIREDPARMKAVDVPVHYGSREKLERLIGPAPLTPLRQSLERIAASVLAS